MSRIAVKVSFLKRIPLFFYCSQAINATNTFIVKIGLLLVISLLRPRSDVSSLLDTIRSSSQRIANIVFRKELLHEG